MDEHLFSSPAMAAVLDLLAHIQSLHLDLSILRDKIHQSQSLIIALASADQSAAAALILDMIAVASSILSTLHHLALRPLPPPAPPPLAATSSLPCHDVVEINAGALLAKYTHHCHVCGKGFRRDANLRMHMRAHGDAYKTRAALTKAGGVSRRAEQSGDGNNNNNNNNKYSCPHVGCRWNWKHEKFQPLKSVACAKNHYKRSHCPKLYVCSRCGNKEFSVLSDLRTHEKHCGNPRWRCTCGTTFSRKDKLLGHLALFVGHAQVAEGVGGGAGNQEELQWLSSLDEHRVN